MPPSIPDRRSLPAPELALPRAVAALRVAVPAIALLAVALAATVGLDPLELTADRLAGPSLAHPFGTDHLGLLGASALPNYTDLPQLAAALSSRFKPAEISKLLGGNYRRVFEVCIS